MKKENDILTEKDKNLIEAMEMFQKDWVAAYPNELKLMGEFEYSERHKKRMERLLKGNTND